MKKSKLLNIFVSSIVAASVIFTTAFAAFPDVSQEKYEWAVDAIDSMSKKGIIKGYEDSTFRPENAITKLEGIVLVARVLGCNDKANETFIDEAMYIYEEILEEYDLDFGTTEVAYLLLKGIIKENELDKYIGEDNCKTPLMRHEVAVLLTKALDAEENLPSAAALTYEDANSIPADSKKYVRYVTDEGLMNGMENNRFSPNTEVTRAQAAVVLKKLLDRTDYTYVSGAVVSYDTVTNILQIKDEYGKSAVHYLRNGVIYRHCGEKITKADISSGYYASITYKDDLVYAIDFTTPLIDDTLYGAVTSVSTRGGIKLGVALIDENETKPSSEKTEFKLTEDVAITLNGEASTIGALKSGHYVQLNVQAGRVKSVEAKDKQSSVSGTIDSVSFDPVFKIGIVDKNGDVVEYLLKDDAVIARNGKSVSATELAEGDKVTATLEYDRIQKISATSKSQTKSGAITAILISSRPKLTLTIDGEEVTYPLSATAEYSITGTDGTNTIYDLRTNTVATITIESDTITAVKTTTTSATEAKTINGEVISVTPAANVFQVQYVDAATGVTQTDTVLINSKTTFIDINGKAQKLTGLSVGSTVTVYGTLGSGIISATTVMKVK